MTFNSIQYAFFLPLVVGTYWLLPRRGQNVLLLVASYVFYGYWDWRFLSLLALSTLIDYAIARRIGSATSARARRNWLLLSISTQLGILGYFKYAGFFVSSAATALARLGMSVDPFVLEIVLPVGISFYTFQTISYTFDVYRGRLEPSRNLLDFAVFVALFPQLVAGPIERARHLLPQVARDRVRPDGALVRSALSLIVFGLFKKVVLADSMGPVADLAFGVERPGAGTVLIGAYAFAIQIYADFSGYTDIARGSARLLGFDLMRNFNQPYLSRNVTEFWQRWHISLSTWLRDYLYIPLGGNRQGRLTTYRNLLITMILGGLWHGAGTGFIVWGAIHGLMLAAHRAWAGDRTDPDVPRWTDAWRIVLTFHLVVLAWIPFRLPALGDMTRAASGLLRGGAPGIGVDQVVLVAVALATVFATDLVQRTFAPGRLSLGPARPLRTLAYAAMIVSIFVWSGGTARPFIYFQF